MKIALNLSTVVGLLLLAAGAHAQTAPGGEAKPAEPKPTEAKPAPTKPGEAKPAEAKPGATPPPPAGAGTEAAPAEGEPEEPAAPGDAAGQPALPPGPATTAAGVGAPPLFPEPASDANALKQQGADRPGARAGEKDSGVFAEDWWSHSRPVLELHGYLRARFELFHHFSLGRVDSPQTALWPRPADDSYVDEQQIRQGGSTLCTPDEVDRGTDDSY
ncbi:MAG TPA: TIGR04551 family protein, partial [Polyangiaceae bacterium]|nr:TIGR04551 family protein [Polyangiaceae bacterium]